MGRAHGKGKLKLENGWTFEGDFVQSSIQGTGRISFPDGGEYEGEVAAGYRKGEYGKRHGQGKMVWVDAEQTYEGEWQNGIQHGEGTGTYFYF